MGLEWWLGLAAILGPILSGVLVAKINKTKSATENSQIIADASKTAVETAELAHHAQITQLNEAIVTLELKLKECLENHNES